MVPIRSVLRCVACVAVLCFCFQSFAQANRTVESPPIEPFVAPASNDGELAMKGFELPPGFKIEVFAAEPRLANPVAFYIDNQGKVYVCETFRHSDGVMDIRGIMPWLDEELASKSVDDRLGYTKRHLGAGLERMTRQTERVRLIEDRDGDGKADFDAVFADGFNGILEGIGAGVLARGNKVWFANIPNLWLLEDTKQAGRADLRRSLHYGFGVRIGFLGHDLHGLAFGPDGKIYFTVGDRGSNIRTDHGLVGDPETGAVFRCNPDGTELEVFAMGLRNPQELAFDEYGNLFTGDNNSDSGDQARFVYLVEGGDSGWRVGFQFMERPYSRGPFNAEKIWHPHFEGQAAYIVPPIANITAGPSGLAYYPGTGLPDQYARHFFLVDFRGGRGSGIHSFALKPQGASFELVDRQHFVWEALPTDVDFGPDGGIYFSDWVQGWSKTGKGRIYHVYQPDVMKATVVRETKKILFDGMRQRRSRELVQLLSHPNQRVRLEAQFELADRAPESLAALTRVARENQPQLARLHAIWGLGQIADRATHLKISRESVLEPLLPLGQDVDAEVRAQAVKSFGDHKLFVAHDTILKLLRDANARVRFFAAVAIGKLGRPNDIGAIYDLLRGNQDRDVYLRHAAVMALTWLNDVPALLHGAEDQSPSVRMGVLLALRRLHRAEISRFLHDSDPLLVLEAARAINDVPISGATPELASLLREVPASEPIVRRAINANFHFGLSENAAALADFAATASGSEPMRREALAALADWPRPSGRDRVVGLWRPIVQTRSAEIPGNALRSVLPQILKSAPDSVRAAAAEAAGRLEIFQAGPELLGVLRDPSAERAAKLAALKSLSLLRAPELSVAIQAAQTNSDALIREQALRLQGSDESQQALKNLNAALASGTIGEKRSALLALSKLPAGQADKILSDWLDQLLADRVPKELRYDVLATAASRSAPEIKAKLRSYESTWPKNDDLAGFRDLLYGGDAEAGRKIFFERPEASCVRCHQVNGEGGEVGPDLSAVGARQTREYMLDSILHPNKQIAVGFESVLVLLNNGQAYAGVVKKETGQQLTLNSPEDGLVTVSKAEIKSRERGLSAMPEGMENVLSKEELRNLVEFLASQKNPQPSKPGPQ